jgi:hypothetical protein
MKQVYGKVRFHSYTNQQQLVFAHLRVAALQQRRNHGRQQGCFFRLHRAALQAFAQAVRQQVL